MSDSPDIRLDHINLPALKPEWLAEWYAEMFGFRANKGFVYGNGMYLVFEEGEPAGYGTKPHFGFRCGSREQVTVWAERLEAELVENDDYCAFKTRDPEGNHFEVYWER